MINKYLLLIFAFINFWSFAQKTNEYEATIYFTNSTVKEGLLKIKENNSNAKKLVFIENSDNKKTKIALTDITKIEIHSNKLQYFYSEINMVLEPVYIEKKKNPLLLYLVSEGKLNLYIDRLRESSSGIHGSVFGAINTYDTYYLKSSNGVAIKVYSETNPSYKKNAIDYFENNKNISSEIMGYGRNFNSSKLYLIIQKYNLQKE